MAGRRLLYGLVLIGSLTLYAAYQEWLSWILLLAVLLFPWFSLILSLPLLFRMKAEPVALARITLGARETVQVRVFPEKSQLPLTCKIKISNPLTGEIRIVGSGDFLPTGHCGGLRCKLHKARMYDFLGLFRFRLRKVPERTFLVLPRAIQQEIPPDLTRYLAQSWRPKPGGGYAENHEIRQYRPGDQLNQIHWKLSAKVGELMLREPMEPERGRMLLTMDLRGTPDELDSKLGQLLWIGRWLAEHQMIYDVCVLTGNGIETWTVSGNDGLDIVIADLLCATPASQGSVRDKEQIAAWYYHIGGVPDEA